METVAGTQGYERVVPRFTELSEEIQFSDLHRVLLPFLPSAPARVLDLGTGTGRDAAALAALGHDVVAIEPMADFLEAAKSLHPLPNIRWLSDHLPDLPEISRDEMGFDFVLCHGVWQHIDDDERAVAMEKVSGLLREGGAFALGLRHGSAGAGTHYFPADSRKTEALAAASGLTTALCLKDQPSLIANKTHVTWTRLVFTK